MKLSSSGFDMDLLSLKDERTFQVMGTKVQHLPEYEALPGHLRCLRERAGLTQRALGELLGKPQSWVQYCETGSRRVDPAELVEWSRACKVDPLLAFAEFVKLGEARRAGPEVEVVDCKN
jgi:DNA-binding transcriptional regulator YiaG